jgi:hypothetical protein
MHARNQASLVADHISRYSYAESAGLLFSALRDPWLRPLAIEISHNEASRQIEVESVEVSASPATVMTASAAILASRASIAMPRLREYFPETLYWQPELITYAHAKRHLM